MTVTDGRTVRFTEDFIFTPDEDRRSAVKYRAGWQGMVRKQCADKAIAAGKARVVPVIRRRRSASEGRAE